MMPKYVLPIMAINMFTNMSGIMNMKMIDTLLSNHVYWAQVEKGADGSLLNIGSFLEQESYQIVIVLDNGQIRRNFTENRSGAIL
uniref:Uncharacterized protein n=1 Tax=Romanomermis culicivorax TaxID=13658 RepID=A0A915JGK2_ROMCU